MFGVTLLQMHSHINCLCIEDTSRTLSEYTMAGNIHSLGNTAPRNGNGPSSEGPATFSSFWYSVPPVSRWLVTCCITVNTLCHLHLIGYQHFAFTWFQTFQRLQIWRMLFSSLILPANLMPALMEGYNLYVRSTELEQGFYYSSKRISLSSHNFAFYLFSCLVVMTTIAGFLFGTMVPLYLTSAFTACLTYTWSLYNTDKKVMFYGLIPVWGRYFPVLQLFTGFVLGSRFDFYLSLIGIIAAYIYNCVDTWTLGPLYGLLIKTNVANYGYEPRGKVQAPGWFIKIYNLFSGETTPSIVTDGNILKSTGISSILKTGGQRLGTRTEGDSPSPSLAGQSASIRSSSSVRTSGASRTQTSMGSRMFPGKGKRVGDD